MENNKKIIKQVIDDVTKAKAVFLKPKGLLEQSLENDAQYLLALGDFIQKAQSKRMEYLSKSKFFEASELQVQILEAVGKYQANEGLVNEKKQHFDHVFMPRYEKELAECSENFQNTLNQSKELVSMNEDSDNKIISYIKKELKIYEEYPDKEIEFDNHTYKILKRLNAKFLEEKSLA